MEKTITRKDIVEQAQKLARLVSESDEVHFFKQAEMKVNQNVKVQELINRIKRQQKQAVHLEHYDKEKALKKTEKSIDQLHEELDDIPIVQEFKQSQREVNALLQMITGVISKTVTDEIIKSTNGDLLSGKTGSSPPDSCSL